MRWVVVLLLIAPVAWAKSPEPSYQAQARDFLDGLARSVHAARTATVEHALGDLTARQAAHALRLEAERVESLQTQLPGLDPPAPLRREHAALVSAVEGYAVGLRSLESCFRGSDAACDRAADQVARAESYRSAFS